MEVLCMLIFIMKYKNADNTGMLIDAIANNCSNIRKLSVFLEPKVFVHIKLLLLNCRCLEYICLGSPANNGNDYIGDELLDILTKYSPNSLTEIHISSGWKYS